MGLADDEQGTSGGEKGADSYAIGTPSSGGSIRVYFNLQNIKRVNGMIDYSAPEMQEVIDKIDAAIELHAKAKKKLQQIGG